MPTAYMLYNVAIVKAGRAPLGSDPSALAMPYGIGRGSILALTFILCRRL
jgi:hypothetical protein